MVTLEAFLLSEVAKIKSEAPDSSQWVGDGSDGPATASDW